MGMKWVDGERDSSYGQGLAKAHHPQFSRGFCFMLAGKRRRWRAERVWHHAERGWEKGFAELGFRV